MNRNLIIVAIRVFQIVDKNASVLVQLDNFYPEDSLELFAGSVEYDRITPLVFLQYLLADVLSFDWNFFVFLQQQVDDQLVH